MLLQCLCLDRIKSSAADWKVGEYTLEYSVKDQCLNEGTTYVIVGVNNTAPEIRNTVISYNIKENNNDETQIMSLTVTDKQTYRCNLGTVSPNDGIFIIKQPTETNPFNLYLKGGSMKYIDYDAKPQYTVTAVCTDDYGLATEKIFYVNVEKNIEPVIDVLPRSYVDSVMATSVVNQFITTADVHNDKTVSNNKRLKRSLDYDSESDSCSENTKKLKPNSVHNDSINLIDGLSISPHGHDHQYTQNKHCSEKVDDICELKSLVVGLASSMNQFCDIITKRMGDIETNIPKQVAQMIDQKVSEEMKKVSCGFWNINGWKVDVDSEKYNFLAECVRYYNLHILGLVETHLTGNTGINIDGYTWFGLNRKEIHIRAKTGSGGVGILIRNDVRDEFNINIVEDNTDGIIWVKFEDKNFAHNCFYVCVIYLPPENSTRAVNIHEFFDILMTNIYTIPQGKPFYICGDWNSRCSDLPDSIEGIDKLPQRNVVDFQHNGYGNIFCDFLTDVNCCILNGRKTLHNDFTFVSTRGMSVVDYCVLPYEHLDNFNNFNVIRTSSIVEQINALGKYDLKKAMPDHSLLTWDFTLNFDSNCCINTQTRGTSETKKKYDTRNLPEDWLCQESTIAEIDNAIRFLENSIADQSSIDNMYENFVKIVKTEMCNKLPAKNIVLSNGFNINKRRRCKKEWWNEELTLLWNEVCKAEKVWIKCKIKRNKRELRHIFVNKRRIFDKAVQEF
ncbi:Hypothetical predicted protein [Mytilus galloprovincialis]|uniref:Endonuclease/exonuclease/phosphatase domain-containing protein n=1 Tax=Mytilus galloprovincialis TaxID=29158 RepID=A0A8B6BX27_MYTGA|nr:Hypothetical predicted protein [Mytilus galloprovincialis]